MKEKQFFIDVDGVLLNFFESFYRFVVENYGHIEPIPPEISDYEYFEWDLFSQEIDNKEIEKAFFKGDYLAQLQPLVDIESYHLLAKNYDSYLITNLPSSCRSKRIQNLEELNMSFTDVQCAGLESHGEKNYPTKSEAIRKLAKDNSRIIFLDDYHPNCEEVEANIPEAEVFILDKPYNKEYQSTNCSRVYSWQDFLEQLEIEVIPQRKKLSMKS